MVLQPTVLVIDDDIHQQRILARWLGDAGYRVDGQLDGESGLAAFAHSLPDLVLLDLHMPRIGGFDLLPKILARAPRVPVIILTADSDVTSIVTAVQGGAFDYLTKPVDRQRLLTVVRNGVEHGRLANQVAQLERARPGAGFPGIVGDSAVMLALYRQLERVAPSDVTVLVRGESGTGKELVARAIHDHSGRRGGPFVAINCAAIPESLQESELFGHERGAFTGAVSRREGRFAQADGGTLFLDEVAELAPAMQAMLLRVVQMRRFYRVGGTEELPVDVRLVAATHRDLESAVRSGHFREDLYYRLAVFELEVPPLRDRGADIALLAHHFVEAMAQRHERPQLTLAPAALELLMQHPWPGNVRQLQNAIERAAVVCSEGVIRVRDLPRGVQSAAVSAAAAPATGSPATHSFDAAFDPSPAVKQDEHQTLANIERRAIADAVARSGGNLSKASRELGIPRNTLYRKLRKHGLR